MLCNAHVSLKHEMARCAAHVKLNIEIFLIKHHGRPHGRLYIISEISHVDTP